MRLWSGVMVLALGVLAGCQSRADLETGRYYRCEAAAGAVDQQCPGGWVCTREGFCQDPAVGAALSCVSSQDCTGGWHCGVDGQCYDRSLAAAVACRQEVPQDCAPGWRCGLEGVCHDTAQAAAYQCQGDPDCEQGWRCGASGVCVDSSGEALRAGSGILAGEVLSPRYPLVAEELAASGSFTDLGTGYDKTVYALRTDGGVWIGTWDQYEGVAAQRLATPGVQRIAVAEGSTYYLDGSGLQRVTAVEQGFNAVETINLAGLGPISGLKQLADGRGALAVFSGNQVGFVEQGATQVSRISTLPAGATVLDLADLSDRWSSGPASDTAHGLVLATEQGLFVAYQSVDGDEVPLPTSWLPISVPGLGNAACGATPSARPTRLSGIYDSWYGYWFLAIELTEPGGGKLLTVLQRDDQTYPTAACPTGEFTVVMPPVDACPGGTLSALDVDDEGQVVVRCRTGGVENVTSVYQGEDGGTQVHAYAFTWWSDPVDRPVTPSPSNGVRVVLDSSGRLGQCDADDYYTCWWETVSQSPLGVVNLQDGGYGVVTHHSAGVGNPAVYFPYADLHEQSDFGLRRTYAQLGDLVPRPSGAFAPLPCSFPRGMRDQLAFCVQDQDVTLYDVDQMVAWGETPKPTAVLSGSASALAQSWRKTHFPSQVTPLADGGQLLVMAVGDALWAGPPSLPTLADGPARLNARLVPQPRGDITSITFTTPRAGGPLLQGYVIAQERVFQVEVHSEQQWLGAPVHLPPGIASAVWSDGERGRVGYRDGRVYSLPAGVQIGAPFADRDALDYAQLCGHGYALTRDTLFRLAPGPGGGVIGEWAPVPLSVPGMPPGALIFYGWHETFGPFEDLPDFPPPDRLVEGEGELLLFTEAGAMIRLTDPECSPD